MVNIDPLDIFQPDSMHLLPIFIALKKICQSLYLCSLEQTDEL